MLPVGKARNSGGNLFTALAVIALALLPIFYNNCASQMRSILGSSGTRTGSPLVEVFFQPYVDAPSFSNLTMCLENLQLYSSPTDFIDVAIPNAEVAVVETGLSVGTLGIPRGTFEKAVLRLGAGCTSSTSISFQNGSQTFSTSETLGLTFKGNMTVTGESARLSFDVQDLLEKLSQVQNNNQINNATTTAVGGFTYGEYGTVRWTGNGSTQNWTDTDNWDENRLPGTADIAVFDSSCSQCDAMVNTSVHIGGLLLKDDFPGLIIQSGSLSVGINVKIYGGELRGGSGTPVSVGGDLIIMTNGKFLTGTQNILLSGNLYVESNFSGPAGVTFEGFNPQDITLLSVTIPTGPFLINKSDFGWVTLKTGLFLLSDGQSLTVGGGHFNIADHKLSVSGQLAINSHIHLDATARVTYGSLVLGEASQVNYSTSDVASVLPLGLNYGGNLNFYGGSWVLPGSLTAKSLTIGGGVSVYSGGFDISVTKFWNSGTWNYGGGGNLIFLEGSNYLQLGTAQAYNVIKTTPGTLSVVDHFTAQNNVTIQTTAPGILELRSMEPGVRKIISVGGIYNFNNVKVTDMQAASPIVVTGLNCVDGGNNLGWTF